MEPNRHRVSPRHSYTSDNYETIVSGPCHQLPCRGDDREIRGTPNIAGKGVTKRLEMSWTTRAPRAGKKPPPPPPPPPPMPLKKMMTTTKRRRSAVRAVAVAAVWRGIRNCGSK